jgi:hypothetical protein
VSLNLVFLELKGTGYHLYTLPLLGSCASCVSMRISLANTEKYSFLCGTLTTLMHRKDMGDAQEVAQSNGKGYCHTENELKRSSTLPGLLRH